MKPAIDVAYELAAKYAQGIWWARTPILSYRDPASTNLRPHQRYGATSARRPTPNCPTI